MSFFKVNIFWRKLITFPFGVNEDYGLHWVNTANVKSAEVNTPNTKLNYKTLLHFTMKHIKGGVQAPLSCPP